MVLRLYNHIPYKLGAATGFQQGGGEIFLKIKLFQELEKKTKQKGTKLT